MWALIPASRRNKHWKGERKLVQLHKQQIFQIVLCTFKPRTWVQGAVPTQSEAAGTGAMQIHPLIMLLD